MAFGRRSQIGQLVHGQPCARYGPEGRNHFTGAARAKGGEGHRAGCAMIRAGPVYGVGPHLHADS